MQHQSIPLLAAGLILAVTATAQTGTQDTTRQELAPIEVRAVRSSADAPFAKTDLRATDIAKQNLGQDLPYLLQQTPSAVITSDAGAGVGYTGIRVRGTDGTRINVTLNGIPVNDAESQGTFFVNFTDIASSTSSLQLQRGVGTSTNGAGAFGATLSLSTLAAPKAGVEGAFSAGSFNTQKYTVKAGTGLLSNGLYFDVRLSKIKSDGYIDRSASDLKSLQFTAGWMASPRTSFRFLVMTGTEKTQQAWNGVPQDSLKTNRTYNELGMKADGTFYDNQTDNYQQDYYQLFADHKFSEALTLHGGLFMTRGRGYYQEYKLDQAFSRYGLADFTTPAGDTFTSTNLIRQLWLDNYFYGGVFSLLYEKNKTQATLGGGFTQYKGKHYGFVKWAEYGIPADYRWYLLDAQKNDFNLYLKVQQQWGDHVLLYGDVQYRNVAYFMNGFRDNPGLKPAVNYNFFNPKVGITYFIRKSSAERQKLYASVALAGKEPNRNDFEAAPGELPKPEYLTDVEAGYEISRQRWTASANFYYMRYKDQLVLTGKINDVGAYTRTNVPNSYRTGIELQTTGILAPWLTLSGTVAFAQNRIEDFTEYVDNYDDGTQQAVHYGTTDIAFSPNTIGSATATFRPFRKHNFEVDLLGRYIGQQYLDNSGRDDRSIDAYGLCDLRFRYSLPLKPFRELGLNITLNNILDQEYVSNGYTFSYISGGSTSTFNYYYPQAGFNWLAGISVKF